MQPGTKVLHLTTGLKGTILEQINAGDTLDIRRQGPRYLVKTRRGVYSTPESALAEVTPKISDFRL